MFDAFSRRSLLAASGGLGLSSSFRSRSARAATDEIPKRVVFVYGGDGLLLGSWEPRPLAGKTQTTTTDWQLGPMLEPLKDYRDSMIFFENLDMVTVHHDPTRPSNAHSEGATHSMTAAFRKDGRTPGAIGIDQFIARELNKNGPVTPLPSLEVACTAHHVDGEAFAKGPGQLVPFLIKPQDVYARLFSKPPATGVDNGKALQEQKLLAFMKEEYASLQPKLPAADREKLVQHGRAVDDLWQRLTLTSNRDANRPDPSILDPAKKLDWGFNAPRDTAWAERFMVGSDINMKLVAAGFHTDTMRVATVDIEEPIASLWGYRSGNFGSSDPHDLTHKVHDSKTSQSKDPQARDAIFREGRLKVGKLKVLLDELARLKEVDGSRLLDHTLVVFVSQIANGSHAKEKLCWFTVGDLKGHFKTGRLIKFARNPHGRPHNDFYTSVANAMGIPITKFGAQSVATGPIQEMNG